MFILTAFQFAAAGIIMLQLEHNTELTWSCVQARVNK